MCSEHSTGVEFGASEVDFRNKSEEFLKVSPTGKVPVVVVDGGDSLYESNIVNQYLDEVYEGPKLMPEDPIARAYAKIWIFWYADWQVDASLVVLAVMRDGGLDAVTDTIVAVEKVEPRTMEDFARQQAAAFTGSPA